MSHNSIALSAYHYDKFLTPLNPTFEKELTLFLRKLWYAITHQGAWITDESLADRYVSHIKTPYHSPVDTRTCYIYHLFKTRAPEAHKKLIEFETQQTLQTPFSTSLWNTAFSSKKHSNEDIQKVLEENKAFLTDEQYQKLKANFFGMTLTELDSENRINMRRLVHSIAFGISYDFDQDELNFSLSLYEKFLTDRGWNVKEDYIYDIFLDSCVKDEKINERAQVMPNTIQIEGGKLYGSDFLNDKLHWIPGIFLEEENISYVFDGTLYQAINHKTNERFTVEAEMLREILNKKKSSEYDYITVSKDKNIDIVSPKISNWRNNTQISPKIMAAIYKRTVLISMQPYGLFL